MDIYNHKKEGIVAFWGNCQMRTATGSYKPATMFRKLQIHGSLAEFLKAEENTPTQANLLATVYVVPTAHWKKHVERLGVINAARHEAIGEGVEDAKEAMEAAEKQIEAQRAAAAEKAAKMLDKMREDREKYGTERPTDERICKGAYAFGSACGECMKCFDERAKALDSVDATVDSDLDTSEKV